MWTPSRPTPGGYSARSSRRTAMLMITELVTATPGPLWRLVKQAGIDHVVTLLEGGEQLWRWPEPGQEDGPPPFVAPPRGERAWDRPALARLQAAYREYGLELAVIEDTAPMDAVRLGTDQLWAAHEYFLRAVVPVAEEAGVRICLHPDDPPLPEVRGVPRIMGTPAGFDRC